MSSLENMNKKLEKHDENQIFLTKFELRNTSSVKTAGVEVDYVDGQPRCGDTENRLTKSIFG